MTGRFGYLPVGDGGVYAVNWTKVGRNQVNGTGKYTWGRMGSYRNGPVTILLTGSNYKYTKISITLTQSWYGTTIGSYPAYGHGAHHTTAHIHLAVNEPTTEPDPVLGRRSGSRHDVGVDERTSSLAALSQTGEPRPDSVELDGTGALSSSVTPSRSRSTRTLPRLHRFRDLAIV